MSEVARACAPPEKRRRNRFEDAIPDVTMESLALIRRQLDGLASGPLSLLGIHGNWRALAAPLLVVLTLGAGLSACGGAPEQPGSGSDSGPDTGSDSGFNSGVDSGFGSSSDSGPVSGADPDTARLEARLDSLRQVVFETARASPADEVASCHVTPFGAKPCGGPRAFLVYSVEATDTAELARVVRQFNELDRIRNERLGLTSDCAVVTAPPVRLSGESCRGGPAGPR